MFGFGPDMIFRIPALLIALTVHEYAHARLALEFGDPTPKVAGRVTLNPIPHLDPFGLLMLFIVGLGWAKPVPINPSNFRNGRKGLILVSLAGIGANLATAVVMMITITVLSRLHIVTIEIYKVLFATYSMCLGLAVFNLIPLPPLDGSQVVSCLLPGRQAYAYQSIATYGPFILMALLYTGIISMVIGPCISIIDQLIQAIVHSIF